MFICNILSGVYSQYSDINKQKKFIIITSLTYTETFPFPVSRFPFPVSRFPFLVSRFSLPVARSPGNTLSNPVRIKNRRRKRSRKEVVIVRIRRFCSSYDCCYDYDAYWTLTIQCELNRRNRKERTNQVASRQSVAMLKSPRTIMEARLAYHLVVSQTYHPLFVWSPVLLKWSLRL